MLEIGLWKMKINALSLKGDATRHQKKIKTDESSTRQQCRVTCGADVVIGHVLPFLITAQKIALPDRDGEDSWVCIICDRLMLKNYITVDKGLTHLRNQHINLNYIDWVDN